MIARVEATRIRPDKTTTESRSSIRSRPARAPVLAAPTRGHRDVENGLNWVLNRVWREDECHVRKGAGAENCALLRRLALTLLHRAPTPAPASAPDVNERIIPKVRIGFCGPGLLMPKHLPDHVERRAVRHGDAGERVAKVMNSHPGQVRRLRFRLAPFLRFPLSSKRGRPHPHRLPRLLKPDRVSVAVRGREHERRIRILLFRQPVTMSNRTAAAIVGLMACSPSITAKASATAATARSVRNRSFFSPSDSLTPLAGLPRRLG